MDWRCYETGPAEAVLDWSGHILAFHAAYDMEGIHTMHIAPSALTHVAGQQVGPAMA